MKKMKKIAIVYMNDSIMAHSQIHMGLASITTYLDSFGHEIRMFDTYHDSDETIIQGIANSDYDLIGFSTTEIHFTHAVLIAEKLKNISAAPIIFGGVYPTICPEECLDENAIDMVCVGEGEYPLNELLEKNNPENIKGVWYKKDKEIVRNGVSETFDVNACEVTKYSYFHENSVLKKKQVGSFHSRLAFVWRSRGCPYRCAYCCNHLIRKIQKDGIRYRKVGSVIKEIDQLKKIYDINELFFTDENFMFNQKSVYEFCEAYQKSNLKLPFGILATPNFFNRKNMDLLKLLKESGLIRIHLGIEIGNEKLRKEQLMRDFSNDEIIEAFKICRELGILTRAFVMIGFYFESEENMRETQELVKVCSPDEIVCSIFYPFQGTELRAVYEEKMLLNENISSISNYFEECKIIHPTMSSEELIQLRKEIISKSPVLSK